MLLDPLHFGAGNSFHQSMYYGTPTVTLTSNYLKAKVVKGAYDQMKVDTNLTVAKNVDDYVDKSISIQHNFNSNYLFQIIDNFGKLILSKSLSSNESLIDLKNIDSGCYFVRIISENKSRIYNKKIIVI